MGEPLAGVRVLEVASHVFVPVAGAVLTEWGAEVLKIEHPVTGDPYRGLVTAGLHKSHNGIDPNFQYANRGKQSVAIDLKLAEGRALLSRFIARSDVFLTNFRPAALHAPRPRRRRRSRRQPAHHLRARERVRRAGPDAERAGYDAAAYWARTGMASVFTAPDAEWPALPRPAFGDVMGGLTIAGAISTALYQRSVTGEAPVVDVSLLGVGMWQLQPDIVNSALDPSGGTHAVQRDRYESWNPLVAVYRTRDGRFISLMMLDADRYWADLCETVEAPDLLRDPRFVDMAARRENSRACIEALERIFAARDFDEWCRVLRRAKGAWAPVQAPRELPDDPQVVENGYLADVDMGNGTSLTMVTSPVQFDGEPPVPARAPEQGEHTETALLDLGLSWDDITQLKDRNVIL